MKHKPLEAGEVFGDFTVIERLASCVKKSLVYKCRCKCGKEHNKYAFILRLNDYGLVCRHHPDIEARAKAKVFRDYQRNCRIREREWSLTDEQAEVLFQEKCFYCGVEPSNTKTVDNSIYTYNGIDRIDNSIGYTVNNSVSCCTKCNMMKSTMSAEEFTGHAERIAYHQNLFWNQK